MIDVKEAAKVAVKYFKDLYEGKIYRDILLEEVELDGIWWMITLGFSIHMESLEPLGGYERKYKIFEINGKTGEVRSMKDRTLENA